MEENYNYSDRIKTIKIKKLVENFNRNFPNSILSSTLAREPQEMPPVEFLAKVETWLSILDSDRVNLVQIKRNTKEEK